MKLQVGQWGNSLAFRIPKHIVEQLDLKVNDAIEYRLEDGRSILEPVRDLPELTLFRVTCRCHRARRRSRLG